MLSARSVVILRLRASLSDEVKFKFFISRRKYHNQNMFAYYRTYFRSLRIEEGFRLFLKWRNIQNYPNFKIIL